MTVLCSRAGHYILPYGFHLSFFVFSLPNLFGRRLDVYYTSTHGVALVRIEFRMHVWNVLQAARWKYKTQKWGKKSPFAHHRTNLSGYIFATKPCIGNRKKNLLNSNTSSRCPHNIVYFGPLMAEICWRVWGTPANFDGFRILPSFLQRRHSLEANQTCTMFGHLLGCYTICIFSGALAPWQNFAGWKIHFTCKSCILVYWQRYCTTLQQRASTKLCGMVQGMELPNFHRGRHLYSAGRPSRWTSAHILVFCKIYWCSK